MSKGFIFNHNKCVACGACNASCLLENGWNIHPRRVITYNSEAFPSLILTNLSMACNHCESAVCLQGCPTAAYTRDQISGAVIIDDKKCIGCRYCMWNCPYDAPKYDPEKRIIGKCNLCYSGLIEGRLPACSNACPTGALDFGELSGQIAGNTFSWFPDKNLNPAIRFTGKLNSIPLRIIPEKVFEPEITMKVEHEKNISGELSLVAFSFLATLSVAMIISSVSSGVYPNKILFASIIIMAGLVSVLHLGIRLSAWRAVLNVRTSPLSREIVAFVLYSTLSFAAVLFRSNVFLIASSAIGLTLLISIDMVYIYSDKRKSVFLHSGQTFLSALLIISFFTGNVLSFIFIALIKFSTSVYSLAINKLNGYNYGIRFIRIALLLISGTSFVSDISYSDNVIIYLFLTGELIDRIIFYIDFNPLNINTLIKNSNNASRNEKKRG